MTGISEGCNCGSTNMAVDAVFTTLPDGSIVGCSFGGVTCVDCGSEVKLNAYTTIAAMDHLLAKRGVPEPIER